MLVRMHGHRGFPVRVQAASSGGMWHWQSSGDLTVATSATDRLPWLLHLMSPLMKLACTLVWPISYVIVGLRRIWAASEMAAFTSGLLHRSRMNCEYLAGPRICLQIQK